MEAITKKHLEVCGSIADSESVKFKAETTGYTPGVKQLYVAGYSS